MKTKTVLIAISPWIQIIFLAVLMTIGIQLVDSVPQDVKQRFSTLVVVAIVCWTAFILIWSERSFKQHQKSYIYKEEDEDDGTYS